MNGYTITGANAADFIITSTSCTTSLSGSCSFSIQFTPSTIGPESATLTVNSSSTGGPILVSLYGEGETLTSSLVASATAMDLGASYAGSPTGQLGMYVENFGDSTISVYTPTIAGANAADFTITASTGCPATLTGNSSCYVYLTFTPSIVGVETATLSIPSTAGTITVALTGTGEVAAGAVLNFTGPVNFGGQTVGTTSGVNYLYVYNVGSASTTFSSVNLTGTNASDFSIYYNSCTGTLSGTTTTYSYCAVEL